MGEIALKQMNVSQFLRQYDSENTRRSYLMGLKQFFEMTYLNSGGDLDILSERYLEEDRDYRDDILNFKEYLEDRAPTTKKTRFNAIRTFLDDNGITFPKRFFKNLDGKTTEPITYEEVPTNEELKRIVEYMPIQGKALTLILASSGMRVGETVELKTEDIEFNREPAKIRIKGSISKTGKKRITFMSSEAKEVIEEWLQFRAQYLQQAKGRSAKYKRAEENDKLFPFTTANFNAIWRNALTKAKLLKIDERTNRIQMRPHNLRKYFRLRVGRFGRDEAEALMGHQEGLNKVYARFEGEDGEKRLEEIYKKAIPELSIYGRSIVFQRADKEVRDRMSKAEDTIDQLIKEGYVKDAKIKHLSQRVEKFEAHVQRMMAMEKKIDEQMQAQDRIEWEE